MIHANLLPIMDNQGKTEKFTGLILLSGVDAPGITESLFETLSPFAIEILDIEQVVIRGRVILTALIACNPAHAKAIEEDLEKCAVSLGVSRVDVVQVVFLDTGSKYDVWPNISRAMSASGPPSAHTDLDAPDPPPPATPPDSAHNSATSPHTDSPPPPTSPADPPG